MKSLLKTKIPFSQNPFIMVIGGLQSSRTKLIQKLLTQQQFLSKKFGRIIYIGKTKYKNIEMDDYNAIQQANYSQLIDFLDQANLQNIVNLLIVFNDVQFTKTNQILEKIMGIRFSYLKGIIGILVSANDINQLNKSLIQHVSTVFVSQTQHQQILNKKFKVKISDIQKKKKQYIAIGEGISNQIKI